MNRSKVSYLQASMSRIGGIHLTVFICSTKETTGTSGNTPSNPNVREPLKTSECFNGAVLEKYMWSQTGSDVDVRVPVASDIKGKDLLVEIKDKYLKVALKNKPGNYCQAPVILCKWGLWFVKISGYQIIC